MITPTPAVTARFAVRAGLPLVALGSVLLVAPAHADPAEGWSNPEDVNMLEALLLLGGVPLLLAILIGLAVYLPALVRGEDVSRPGSTVEDQWLGGPRPGTKELAQAHAESGETGGARGRW